MLKGRISVNPDPLFLPRPTVVTVRLNRGWIRRLIDVCTFPGAVIYKLLHSPNQPLSIQTLLTLLPVHLLCCPVEISACFLGFA